VSSETNSASVEGDNHSCLDLTEDYETEEPKPDRRKRKRSEDDEFRNILALLASANNTRTESDQASTAIRQVPQPTVWVVTSVVHHQKNVSNFFLKHQNTFFS
jgi:hypothetical protein